MHVDYKILEVRLMDETLWTKISYEYDRSWYEVDIPHMNLQTQSELVDSIKNRLESEIRRFATIEKLGAIGQALSAEIDVLKTVKLG
jgi:hypothetical protein